MFKNISEGFKEILRDLHRAGYEEAVIHGGALRDLALGKEGRIKDIDIAVQPERPGQYLGDYMCNLGWSRMKERNVHEMYDAIPDLQTITEFKTLRSPKTVQVCSYTYSANWFVRHVINNNDFGINQIAFNGERFFFTTAFERDVATKTFTALKFKTAYQARNAIKRAKNWQYSGDYKGFKFDVSRAEEFLKNHAKSEID
jgi:hypothetical protein